MLSPKLRSFFTGVSNRKRVEVDIDEELRFHFEELQGDLIRRGFGAEEARLEAMRRFGNMTLTKDNAAMLVRCRSRMRRCGMCGRVCECCGRRRCLRSRLWSPCLCLD